MFGISTRSYNLHVKEEEKLKPAKKNIKLNLKKKKTFVFIRGLPATKRRRIFVYVIDTD